MLFLFDRVRAWYNYHKNNYNGRCGFRGGSFLLKAPTGSLFSGGQVQLLLVHRRASQGIFRFKVCIRRNAQLVVGLSLHEAVNKIGGIEAEHAVIEHHICSARKVLIAQRRMPEKFINLASGRTRKQAEADAVALLGTERRQRYEYRQ